MFDAGAIVFHIKAAGAALFRQEMSEADKAAERLGRTSETASSKTEQLGSKQETAAQKARRLAQEQAAAEKAAREYADAQEHVGKMLVGAGAAIVGTTGLVVKSAMDWESAWAGVTKTVEGTPQELDAVEQGLRDLTGVLPASHDEIAAVAEAAGQLGVKTKDVVGFTRTMIDLGETTNLTSDQAATSLAQLMNIMGTAGEDVDRLGSTIVALGNDGASTEAEIVSMAQRIAGSGKLVGATEGEVLALANALASMGVTAELGGGVASRILQDLYSAVQTGGQKLEGFAAVAGVSAKDFATAFKNDPVRAMGSFATGLNGVEAAGGNVVQTLNDLGFKSTEEQRVLLQLKSSGDLLTDSLELQNTAWQENSALTNEAAKRYDTVESQLGIMRNRINDAAIDLGSVFLPVVSDVAAGIGDFADGVASLPAPLQEAIAVGGLLVGVVALVGGTAMIAVPKVITLWQQIQMLSASGTRAGSALRGMAGFLGGPWGVALVAATALMVGLSKANEQGRASVEDLQNSLVTGASSADLFAQSTSGRSVEKFFWGDYAESLKDLPNLLDRAASASNDWLDLTFQEQGALGSIEEIGQALAKLATTDLPAASRSFQQLVQDQNLTDEQAQELLRRMPDLRNELVRLATENEEAGDDVALLNKLLKESAKESQTASEAYMEQSDSVQSLTDELIELIETINTANGLNQDAISANADYQAALEGITTEVERQKEAYKGAHDTLDGFNLSLDENTAAGSANAEALAGVADAAQNAASKQFELDQQTMSGKDAAEKYASTLANQRQKFIESAIAAGYNADEVKALADRVFQLPTEREVKILADTAKAQTDVDSYISRNTGREIILKIGTSRVAQGEGGGGGITQADGGVVSYHANGSVSENHVAQIARAGEWRVWAEDETGGETYVPHAPSKRARSEAIMAETARLFGGTYIPAGAQRLAEGSALTGARTAPVATFPERLKLVVGEREFDAYVREHGDAAAAARGDKVTRAIKSRKWDDA
ncbi:phage tail tape measure protein [Microbacterium sp. kSW2-24]|uniref:phage tail tape measure protein n=1 Tax=Microbacterium galbinum TaxID=2851646 RepID=UPI001FFD894B|nr:phage tail tape measure protein [Microbacterium galbinum]MCK2024065.1 phage tail tape measure protein [Microbacterium galbinum]